MRSVAAIPALGLLAGSAAGLLVPNAPPAPWLLALALGAWASWRAFRAAQPEVLVAAVVASFFAGGVLLAADSWRGAWRPSLRVAFENFVQAERQAAEADGRPFPVDGSALLLLSGTLRTDAVAGPSGASLNVSVTSARPIGGRRSSDHPDAAVNGGVLLTVGGAPDRDRLDEWRAGRIVRVAAALRRPSRYLNPGIPDQERVLARRGITLVGSVKSGLLVEVVARGGLASESAAAMRTFVRQSIESTVGRWSDRSAAIVKAIVIGDRTGLDSAVERRLQAAGTYHVIAISGGNVAILTGLTLAMFRMGGWLGRAAMTSAIAGLLAYGYLVGTSGGSSVERATLMAVVHLAGRATDLRGSPLNTLAFAGAALVAADPLAVTDSAFLLTFGATAGILVFVPAVPTVRLPRPLALAVQLGAASAAAQGALLPASAFLFSQVTFAGLLLNLAAVPLMAVAQIAGMAVVPASWLVPSLAAAIGWVAHLGAEGLVRSSDLLRVAPSLSWRVAPPHWVAVAAYYVGLVAAWILVRRRVAVLGSGEGAAHRLGRRAALAVTLAAAVWIAAEPSRLFASGGDGRLHVTFIDVGQGDAVFVRFPQGTTLLVDAGGLPGTSFDVGDRVVAPVLRREGVRRLDLVAFTHGDADHIGGLDSIVREFRPREVWEGVPVARLPAARVVRASADEVHARWVNVQANDRQSIDGVSLVVRHPPLPDWERPLVRNDDSIVMELVWREASVLLTGDIGQDVERTVASSLSPVRFRAVKVPHHGSLTSSSWSFVSALGPRVAVISAGRANPFGHPAGAVLDRYRAVGAELFRTDLDGAVTVETDGQFLEVRTYTGRLVALR